jgi:HEXXH motif-containing protein
MMDLSAALVDARSTAALITKRNFELLDDLCVIASEAGAAGEIRDAMTSMRGFAGTASESAMRSVFMDPRLEMAALSLAIDLSKRQTVSSDHPELLRTIGLLSQLAALGLAAMDRRPHTDTIRSVAPWPLFIPGLGIEVDCDTTSILHLRLTAEDGAVIADPAACGTRSPRMVEVPTAGEVLILRGQGLFKLPYGFPSFRHDGDEYSSELQEWKWMLRNALLLTRADTESAELVDTHFRAVVPIRRDSENVNLSVTMASRPSVIYMTLPSSRLEMAETLVHEVDHVALARIEELHGAQVTTDDSICVAKYFAPWRHDPRPLAALLKGLSAFARVSRFLAALLSSASLGENERHHCGRRAALLLAQCDAAMSQIAGNEYLSDLGKLVRQMASDKLDGSRHLVAAVAQYGHWLAEANTELAAQRAAFFERNPNMDAGCGQSM